MIPSYRVIIPTRDSAQWVGQLLNAYRVIGVEPLYVVDTRSRDGTLELLQDLKADYVPCRPHGDIVEAGMIEFGSKAAATEWVLRMDDDEFPSRNLFDWIENVGMRSSRPFWGISRREVSLRDEGFVYSRWPTHYEWTGDCFRFNIMWRLHRVNAVNYIERVHTPGFECPAPHAYAPETCFFIHFNNIIRSLSDRIAKVRKYASLDERLSWRVTDESLPELTDAASHNFTSDGLAEFLPLLKSLPVAANSTPFELTARERTLMTHETQYWLAVTARTMQEKMCIMQETIRMEREIFWLSLVPRWMLRPLAEFLLSLGRLVDSRAISEVGLRAWNYQKQRAAP